MIHTAQIEEAALRIEPYLYQTPLEYHPQLSAELDCRVFLKFENQQLSGSFKARGAFNRILSLQPSVRSHQFFVAASTGNHAAAFCTVLKTLQLPGKVFLPENVAESKLDFIKAMDIPFELIGENSLQTEIYCRKVAEENDFFLVHPYNDPEIIAGQGTVVREMLKQQPGLDVVIVPVGGGGLISGIGIYLKENQPQIRLIGCQPAQSPEMVESLKKGYILEEDISRPTLSDGTAGGMEPGSMTFELCREYVDDWALIEENEIAYEIVNMLRTHQMLIEGAAALPLAYLRRNFSEFRKKNVGIVISGKRLSISKLRELLNQSSFSG